MKLAFCLFKFFPYGGLERNFLRIAQCCSDRGHSVDVYTMSWEGPKPDNISITIIPVKHWNNHGRNEIFIKQVNKLFEQKKYDVVVGFNKMPGLDLYYAADPCFVEKIYRTKPAIFKLTGRYKHFAKCENAIFSTESKTKIMVLARSEQEKYIHYYHTQADRFHILPAGISLDRKKPSNADEVRSQWRAEFNIKNDEKVILMIGSAFRRKGLDRALLGLSSLPEELKSKTHLIMIGKDNPKTFLSMAESLGVSEQFKVFLGRDDIPRFLLGSDLFTHPAYSENTGNVILEAIIAGLPVLASGVCGFAFHIERSKTGLVTPEPFSQQEYNKQLAYMLNSSEYSSWVKNGIEYGMTEDLYSRPETVANIIDSFEKG